MSTPPGLKAYLHFEAVARRGSVTRASEELSVSPSAVSQQIKNLEQALGIRLFRRDGRRLSLTLEGEQLYRSASSAMAILRDAERTLSRTSETRRLNLRVTPSFGVRWLGPRLAGFIGNHPETGLSVDAAPDPTDFEREVMDLDIRYGVGPWDGFHAQPLVRDAVLPLCSPSYLAELGADASPGARLNAARLIDSARAICQWDRWLLRTGIQTESNRKSTLMDRSSIALQLALDGAGVILESLALAAGEVAEGRLVPVAPTVPVLTFPAYWVICPSRNMNRRAVRIFLDWIEGEAVNHEKTVSGIIAQYGLRIEDFDPQDAEVSG